MATFTMTLNDVLSYGYDIGLQNDPQRGYPLFDEAYRPTLNARIIDHFRFQEIGEETVEMFIFALNRKMREIMPFYNEMYKSTLLSFSPLDSTDYTETISSNATRNATDNTTQLRADEARNAEILGRIPAGRWGLPEDLGGAVVFLSSKAADYINGYTVAVDGGWLAR